MTAGTWRLVRFILRRDRVRLAVWVLSIAVVVLGSVASFAQTYPTAADRQARAGLLAGNAAAQLFVGPGYGTADYTFGAMTANEMLPLTTVVVALMSVFLMIRHTRAEEEDGRAELLRAQTVGRLAQPAAALVVVGGANLVLCVLLAAGLPAALTELSAGGSLAFAAAVCGIGLVFAGVALLVAQLTVSSRAAVGMAGIVLGALYLVRAVGDLGDAGLAWLSPFGWATGMRAYVGERWWPLALTYSESLSVLIMAMNSSQARSFKIACDRLNRRFAAIVLGSRIGRPILVDRIIRLARLIAISILL